MTVLVLGLAPLVLGLVVLVVPRGNRLWIGAARTLALAAALAVVLAELLPAAVDALGLGAVLLFAAAFAVPAALERRREQHGRDVTWEASLAALVGHQVADGVQMSLAAEAFGPGAVLGFAVHGAPLVAVVLLGTAERWGRASALRWGLGLIAVTAAAIIAADAVPTQAVAATAPWLGAVMSGLLLHGLAHDLTSDLPGTPLERAVDLAAGTVGFAAPVLVAGLDHTHLTHADRHVPFLATVGELTIELAPAFVIMAAFGALLDARGELSRRAEAFGVAALLFGLPFATLRLLGEWLVEQLGNDAVASPPPARGSLAERVAAQADGLMIGLLVAAWCEIHLPDRAVAGPSGAAAVLLAAFLPVGPTAILPLAAVLWHKGLPVVEVMALALLAPALEGSHLQATVDARGVGPTARRLASAAGAALLTGAVAWLVVGDGPRILPEGALQHAHGVVGGVGVAALLALVLPRVWTDGFRGWLAHNLGGLHDGVDGHRA